MSLKKNDSTMKLYLPSFILTVFAFFYAIFFTILANFVREPTRKINFNDRSIYPCPCFQFS